MPRERSRYHDRRSSSSESNSSRGRKQSKSKHRRRSRSRNQSESSHRRKRSSSRSRHKRRSYSRSLSRDRHESKSKRRSSRSRSKRSRRSLSREQSRTRSSSRARSKHNKSSKKSCRRSRSSSSRSSFDIEKPFPRKDNLDDTETKLEKAIKAAEAAGLTMTKIPTYEYKEVEIKEEMPTIHDRNLIDELNSDSFVPKTFTSSRNKKQSKNIVIDLDAQTVKVPDSESKVIKDDSIIDCDEIPPEEDLKEMWIKKLYLFRKKMLKGEL